MRTAAATVMAVLVLGAAAPAEAFDAGPHSDMTRDALTAEGFGGSASDVGVVEDWFVDFYWNAKENPFSGHADAITKAAANAKPPYIEFWPDEIIEGTNHMHF